MAQFNVNLNLSDWLPMPFWLGPPLPIALAVYWPFINESQAISLPFKDSSTIFSSPGDEDKDKMVLEFPDGYDKVTKMPKKIVVTSQKKSDAE